MPHITVLTCEDDPGDCALAEAWFHTWAAEITYNSGDTGCGCCVHIWDVTCSDAASAALPEHLHCASSWSEPKLFRNAKR